MSDREKSVDDVKEIIETEREEDPEKKRRRKKGCGRKIRKAKHLILFPFRKAKKLYKKKTCSSATNPSGKISSGSCLCFTKPPLTLDSPTTSQTSDPNSREFSFDRLKLLIEKNDFYSRECNVHTDFSNTH